MSKITQEIHVCPFCRRTVAHVTTGLWGEKRRDIRRSHAVTITLGYSIGGWGRREDWLAPTSTEDVCEDCFAVINKHAIAMVQDLKRREQYPDESEDDAVIRRAVVKP